MKITCPSCGISYEIQEDNIGSEGRKVRCSRCNTQWSLKQDAPAPDEKEPENQEFEPEPQDDDPPETIDVAAESDLDEETEASPDEPEEVDDSDEKPKGRGLSLIRRNKRSGARKTRIRRVHSIRMTSNRRTMLGALTLAASLVICFSTVLFRHGIVDKFPDLASLYELAGFEVNLRKLEFGDLRVFREQEGGEPVLVLEGAIDNPNKELVTVPAIRFALRNEDAQEIYAWTLEPRVLRLDAGQSTRFRTRLVSPPELASEVQLRFTERRKRQASL
ncbi:MAG: zinc-ribbon domain-containing protein [Stappiaceae bacterium]